MNIEMSHAPWTDEQVQSLRRRQHLPFHEYTCGTDSEHGRLLPTRHGWVCPACEYRQDNAIKSDTELSQADFESIWRSIGQEPPKV